MGAFPVLGRGCLEGLSVSERYETAVPGATFGIDKSREERELAAGTQCPAYLMVDVERAVGLELRFAFVVVLQVGVSPSADQVRTVDLARTDFDDEIVGRTRYFGRRRGHGPCPDPLPVGILHVCRAVRRSFSPR